MLDILLDSILGFEMVILFDCSIFHLLAWLALISSA